MRSCSTPFNLSPVRICYPFSPCAILASYKEVCLFREEHVHTSNTLRKGMTEKDQEKWVSTALANDTLKSLGHENDFNTIRHPILLITT